MSQTFREMNLAVFRGEAGWLDPGKTGSTWMDEYSFVRFGLPRRPEIIESRRV